MLSKVNLTLLTLAFVHVALAIEYRSTLLNQRITHYENPYIDLEIKNYGDEQYPYMVLKDVITPYDDLHLMLYARVYDQPPNLLTDVPVSICSLLHDPNFTENSTIAQYNLLQSFNLAGRSCPIENKIIRLSPYIFPSTFTYEVNFGCGYMNVEARLMKCKEEVESSQRQCETLLKTVSLVFLINEECQNDEQADDGWIIDKVDPT